MTCIVGVVDTDGTVVIGGDSAGVAGLDLTVRADQKVFRNGPYIMGFTESFRMGQLLRYAFVPPEECLPGRDLHRFMVTTFIDAVRQCLKDGGYATKDREQESGGTFLVGCNGRLFTIHSDYQVAESKCDYMAVGCGDQAALGAMYATQGQPVKDRVLTALQAAEQFSAGVRGPFTIEELRT